MISMGPAIRRQKKSNAPRSVSVIENDSMEGGGDGVADCIRYGLTVNARDEPVPEEEASSSLFMDGLLDAGRSRRDITRLPGGKAS
jgi:hypothetical protein